MKIFKTVIQWWKKIPGQRSSSKTCLSNSLLALYSFRHVRISTLMELRSCGTLGRRSSSIMWSIVLWDWLNRRQYGICFIFYDVMMVSFSCQGLVYRRYNQTLDLIHWRCLPCIAFYHYRYHLKMIPRYYIAHPYCSEF